MFVTSLTDWWGSLATVFPQLWQGLNFIFWPLLGAVLVLLIGWFLALFFGQLIKKILGENNIPWGKILGSIGLANILEDRLKLSADVGAFLGWLVKWFLLIASFMVAVSILNLATINVFLGQLVVFLPAAVTAAIIVFLGFFFGKFISQVLVRVIEAIGIKADLAGLAIQWIIVIFSILAAAQYLNLQLDILWPKFIDFLVLAGAIAIGFGLSSRAGEWLEKIKNRLR